MKQKLERCRECGSKIETDRIWDANANKIKVKCSDCGNVLRFESKPKKQKRIIEKIKDYLNEEEE